MADYSAQDMLKMQQDAVKRVQNMQQRARQTLQHQPPPHPNRGEPSGQSRTPAHHQPQSTSKPPPEHSTALAPQQNTPKKNHGLLDMLNLKSLLKDSDTALILTVLLLIADNESDTMLLLALLYILM